MVCKVIPTQLKTTKIVPSIVMLSSGVFWAENIEN